MTAGRTTAVKPTIVFVHGAFADSSGWNAEIATLRRLGYPVVAAPDELRGLTSDADYVRSILTTVSGPVVLVGHSYGGAVITNAARGVPNVKALVYVGAFVPDQGESIATVLDPAKYPGSLLGPATTVARPFPNPAAPGGTDIDVYIKEDSFRAVFAADVPASTAAVMAATQRPLSLTAQNEPSGEPAWKTIPSWSLITLDDKAIPAAGQRFMSARAHARIRTVHSSHAVMVSHPDAVVAIVRDAADSRG
ncbi:alpha/beta hydrolase [Microbispora sp. RL4-1S]|uniref:Alpha/beta hydrolase n=2 Tax=Microbispora oryzae TaxID=2806554 RepID=A0A941ARY8_9ACTN|nr:alpha/beta hydrolase [Microbispora oryzae]